MDMKAFWVVSAIIVAAVNLVAAPVSAQIPSTIGETVKETVKGIIIDIVNFLTPIISIVCIGMIVIGLIMAAFRQEFYAMRLIVGGGVGLAIIYLVIPVILSFL